MAFGIADQGAGSRVGGLWAFQGVESDIPAVAGGWPVGDLSRQAGKAERSYPRPQDPKP